MKRRKDVCTHVTRMNVFVCNKTRVAVQCSGKSRARDKMQAGSELPSQDIPDELKTV